MKKYLVLAAGMVLTVAAYSQDAPKTLNNKLVASGAFVNPPAALAADVAINPNPVKGESFSLQLLNLEKGKYNICIHNREGRKFLLKVLAFDGGSATESISLPEDARTGTYILQVVSKTARFSKKMVIE